jgi:hypothetical protein
MMPEKLTRAQRQAEYAKRTGYKAQTQYTKENTMRVLLVFNKNTEPDLIIHLQSTENKSGYIKRLIREDIQQNLKTQ